MVFTLCLIVGIGGAVFYFWKINPSALDALKPACTISFDTGTVGTVDDITIVSGKTIELPQLSRDGYTFDGWYDGDKKWDENTKITKSTTLIAKWIPNKYKIVFVVDGTEQELMCDYDSLPEFPDGTPSKAPTESSSYEFKQWQPAITIVKGEARYEAVFNEVVRKFDVFPTANFSDAGIFTYDEKVEYGGNVTITVSENVGYHFIGWYMDDVPYGADYENYTITITNVTADVNIVARFELTAPPVSYGFYNSKPKFDTARTTKTIQINSEEELVLWLEYVEFYNIQESQKVNITFGGGYDVAFLSASSLGSYMQEIFDKSHFPSGSQMSYYYTSSPYRLTSVYITNDANAVLNDADELGTSTLTQYEFGLLEVANSRAIDYDNFPYMARNKEIEVVTSNQLVYALESGLKPVAQVGSIAETILNQAKGILRKICSDSMSNLAKIRAIYEWLILNVQYDHKAAETSFIFNNWQAYDAWYADGVFLKHKAVCDGISKALLILARIEDIPCIRISGTIKESGVGHAWNKVYIGGYWWGIDATHGDMAVNSEMEVLTYTSFLFTDDYKLATCDYEIEDGTETPNVARNVYADFDYTGFDLYIDSLPKLSLFETYLNSYIQAAGYYVGQTDDEHFTIEVSVESDIIADVLINYIATRYSVNTYIRTLNNFGKYAYAFVLPKD